MGNRSPLTAHASMATMLVFALARSGTGTLFINDDEVAEGRIDATQPSIFSADETAAVGIDLGTPVVESIGAEAASRLTGQIPRVKVEVR